LAIRSDKRRHDFTTGIVVVCGTFVMSLPRVFVASYVVLQTAAPAVETQDRQPRVVMRLQESGTRADLSAVSAVDRNVAWVVGDSGAWLRTTDGGATWSRGVIRSIESALDLRDVHGVNATTAYALSAGRGRRSTIWKTTDGGRSWRWQFTNYDPDAAFRCFAFWDGSRGFAVSDAITDQLVVVRTTNGVKWEHVPPRVLPAALPGEHLFAESGGCATAARRGRGWFGLTSGRVLRTTNMGRTWRAALLPLTRSDSTAIVSLSFRDFRNGIAFAGPVGAESDTVVAVTTDGGKSWKPRAAPPLRGLLGGAFVPSVDLRVVVAAGTTGLAYSTDEARTWLPLDSGSYRAVAFKDRDVGWAVGAKGTIARLFVAGAQLPLSR
jgi:photosystem II stability/assembly factor-like uncharacterized protein